MNYNPNRNFLLMFQPDYVSGKELLKCGILLGSLLIIYTYVFPVPADLDSEKTGKYDYLLWAVVGFTSLFCFLAVIRWIYSNRKYKGLRFGISATGVSVISQGKILRDISWNDIQEIFVIHGPCEPDWPPDLDFLDGPYGVYISLQPNCQEQLNHLKSHILNLNYSTRLPYSISNYTIIRLYKNIRLKKCEEVVRQLIEIKNTSASR